MITRKAVVIAFICHFNNYSMHEMHMGIAHQQHTTMHGMYGRYSWQREATGTSWEPEATVMPVIHRMHGPWTFMMEGFAFGIYDHQRGPRGGKKVFSENMFMVMAQRDKGCSTFGLRGMFSLEPLTIGKKGYPLLLQTGETANGRTPLIDRQHPHDLFMELAATYSLALSEQNSFFLYFGIPGEPALGPPVYMNRFSAVYNPEAPITHHWFDSTHISFGVATLGYIGNWWKIDASLFNGREPDQHRFDIEKPRFDSRCIRLTINPLESLSWQFSYGFLKKPEQLEPHVNIQRCTTTLSYHRKTDRYQWQSTGGWGLNKLRPGPKLNALFLESTLELKEQHIFFGRIEWVAKNELFIPPDPRAVRVYKVAKLNGGYIYEFFGGCSTRWGVGFSGSVPLLPQNLKRVYGGQPFSYMLFLRVELREKQDH
jgi:hypothetical protein